MFMLRWKPQKKVSIVEVEKEKKDDLYYTFEFLGSDMKLNVLYQEQRKQEKLLKEQNELLMQQNQVLQEIRKESGMKTYGALGTAVFAFIAMAASITTCNKVNKSQDNEYKVLPETRSAKMPNACDSTAIPNSYILAI